MDSVPRIIETNYICVDFLSVDGNTYEISINLPETANIPAGSELIVEEVDGSSYKEEALHVLSINDNNEVGKACYFQFKIVKEGEELSIDDTVEVSIKLKDQKLDEKTEVVQFTEKTSPELLDNVVTDDTAKFETKALGIYGVYALRTNVQTVEGDNYTVTMTYGADADIPEGAELHAVEVSEMAAMADGTLYVDAAAEKLGVETADGIKLFDIFITNGEEKVQPKAAVSVKIELNDAKAVDDTAVVHFGETGLEVLDKSIEEGNISFETDGFSMYAIVGTELVTDITLPGSDDTYEVHVTYGADAKIPEGATLDVKSIEKGSAAYEKAKEQIVNDKKEKDADFNEATFKMAALDIRILDADGKAVEPAEGAKVTVSIKMKELPANASEESMAGTLEVQHLNTSNGETVVETVAKGDEVDVSEGTASAEFTIDSFSTFALTWTDGSATIHYGTMDGGDFTEFEEDKVALLDTTASSVSLENNFAGYSFMTAYYVESGSEDQTIIDPVLYKQEGKWFADKHITETGSDVTTIQRDGIANNSDIYVVYTAPQSHPQSGSDVQGPTTTKTVTENPDGTYTVQLDVEAPVTTETDSQGANVLIILDRTSSMSNRMSRWDSTTRWSAAKSAIETLVTTLKSGDNANNDIDFALMDFYMGVNPWGTAYTSEQETLYRWDNSYWTKDNTTYMSTVNGISLPSKTATCWQLPLNNAQTILSQRDSDQTYVIFITDGEPNCFQYTNGTIHSGSSYPQYMAYYNQLAANGITDLNKVSLYGVFCGSDSGYSTLNNLITNADGVKTINGTDAEGLKAEFADIAHYIVDNLGSKDVSVDDGVPSLSSISAKTAGEASGYEYLKKGPDDTDFQTWDDAPGATYSNDNGVTWDLSAAGTLAKDTTYRLRFKVWPSQDAYDLIADLNNGVKTMTDAELEAAGIEKGSDGKYTLKTNTHLQTTFTYKGETYTDPNSWTEESMNLPTETISIKKVWNNPYDPDVHDPGASADLYVTKDGELYLEGDHAVHVTAVGADGRLDTPDDWTSTQDIFISCGFISKTSSGYEVMEDGHDYSIAEPASFSYLWDLTSPVYHPMVINGQDAVILILDDNASGTEGTNYYVIKGSDGENHKYRVASSSESTLTATNDRRSYLDVIKAIDDQSDDQGADADSLFEYTCTIGETGDEDIYFSAYSGGFLELEGTNITKEIKNGTWTGYYYTTAGSTFTFKVKAGWSIRFTNLPVGTEYSIQETDMATGFSFEKADGESWNYKTSAEETYSPTANASTATVIGSIDESNHSYKVTITNKYEPSGVELTVNKTWDTGTPAFVTAHGAITVALFRDANGDGVITADEYIGGTERTLTNGSTSVTYDKLSSLDGIVVREVTISTETSGEGEDAVTTKTVTPIDPNGQISVSGETTTTSSDSTNTYVVTYKPGTETDNSRTDSITNTLVKTPIEITKIGGWTVNTKLSGVQFKIFSDENCTTQLQKDSTGADIGTAGLITTGSDGKATIGTFIAGTYYLQEVKTADGYNLLDEVVEFTIKSDGTIEYSTGNNDFDSTTKAFYELEDGGYGIYVNNLSGVELPMTGGSGTLPYTLGGIALIMASALMYGFRMRRRERRLN